MGYTKEQLLARLQELQIEFTKYDHPVVLTVEAQAKYVGNVGAALSKNLFLKDKKNRFYVVSALTDNNVDLKVLSQRLGLGKGGVRMAPEEALGEILQVLPIFTDSNHVDYSRVRDMEHVSLMLDQGFKSQKSCIFHPLSNDTSIALTANDLDKFLHSIGREASYVDLQANPKVGKDQPPDLAALVPSESIALPDTSEKAIPPATPPQNHAATDPNPKEVKAKSVKPPAKEEKAKGKGKEKALGVPPSPPKVSFSNPSQLVEEILDKTSSLLISQITEDNIKEHGAELGLIISDSIRKHLSGELKNLAVMFEHSLYRRFPCWYPHPTEASLIAFVCHRS